MLVQYHANPNFSVDSFDYYANLSSSFESSWFS